MNHKNTVGRPKTFEKDEILRLAMYHFWVHGYSSTNLDDLLVSMGIKKSSFYRTFKSKEEVFSLSLSLYRKEYFEWMYQLEKEKGTKNSLLEMIKLSISEVEDTGKVKGCLLMNSGKECYLKYNGLSKQIAIEFEEMLDFTTTFIQKAQERKEILNTSPARSIAIEYLTLYNGVIMMLQAGLKTKDAGILLARVEMLLE